MATHREAVEPWYAALAVNLKRQVNHPTTVRWRFERDRAAPKVEAVAASWKGLIVSRGAWQAA